MRGLVLFGVSVVALTEVLSAFHLIRFWPLLLGWIVFAIVAIRPVRKPSLDWAVLASIAPVALLVLVVAWKSAPNSTDAMAYHLPRV